MNSLCDMLMKLKSNKNAGVMLLIISLLSTSLWASGAETTDSTGRITGTPPVFYNKDRVPGHINIVRQNVVVDDNDGLDINDDLAISWDLSDQEGDPQDPAPEIEWVCKTPSNEKHVIATGTTNYIISTSDKACTIGVNITPKTLTGLPQENTPIEIEDISSYQDGDNIPDGPVNPHSINVLSYTIAPNNADARLDVDASQKLTTAFAGAQVQIVTDNPTNELNWTSSNDAIATVSDTGLVTFKAKGGVKITARHNEVRASIIFNPQLFFLFSQKTMNWHDAEDWCENQGYRLPPVNELSVGKNKREASSGSLWQEWGNSIDDVTHAGVVFWSSDLIIASEGAYDYMYTKDGSVTSNTSDKSEGFACVE